MRVLVVEDEPLIAASMEWELRDAGYEVVGPASDPAHAEALCDCDRPDLALVDINLMDRGDGIALARRLARRGVRSLFVSGQIWDARENRDAALGLIAKPFAVERLPEAVDAVLALLAGGRPVIPPCLELFTRPQADAPAPFALQAAGR